MLGTNHPDDIASHRRRQNEATTTPSSPPPPPPQPQQEGIARATNEVTPLVSNYDNQQNGIFF